jgi:hypothetical protein
VHGVVFAILILERAYLHLGESVGTFGHGQFFQLPSESTQADGAELFVGAGLLVGAALLVGAGALAVLTGAAKRWST